VNPKSPRVIEASANIESGAQTVKCCPLVPWGIWTPFIAAGGGGQEYKGSRAVVMLRGGESESL
jgi:hypothetical protein